MKRLLLEREQGEFERWVRFHWDRLDGDDFICDLTPNIRKFGMVLIVSSQHSGKTNDITDLD